jgi:hypothetical protein
VGDAEFIEVAVERIGAAGHLAPDVANGIGRFGAMSAHAGRLPRAVRLKPDYPMAAPGRSRQRSEMAQRVGLGRRVQAQTRRRQPRSDA